MLIIKVSTFLRSVTLGMSDFCCSLMPHYNRNTLAAIKRTRKQEYNFIAEAEHNIMIGLHHRNIVHLHHMYEARAILLMSFA